jgi:hypothetical protein
MVLTFRVWCLEIDHPSKRGDVMLGRNSGKLTAEDIDQVVRWSELFRIEKGVSRVFGRRAR